MRIDVIQLISGIGNEAFDRRGQMLRQIASPGTDIRLIQTSHAPTSIESFAEMEAAAPGILERVVQSEREGADAIIIWGGHDPSLVASRELVAIPVIGPGMASMHIASVLAERFSLLVPLSGVIGIAQRQVRDLGLERRCASIRSVGIAVLQIARVENFDAVRQTAIGSIEDGADAICFGCMAFADHAEPLSKALARSHPDVIVIHPGKAAVRLAELLVGMGLSHSKRSYPYPPKEVSFYPK